MKYSLYLLTFLYTLFLGCVEITQPYSKVPPGIWRGTLTLEDAPDTDKDDVVLPFNFEIEYTDEDHVKMTILNGSERIEVTDISFWQNRRTGKDSMIIDFPLFDTHIEAEHRDHIIQGFWYVHYRDDYKIPFLAYHGNDRRFEKSANANHDIDGQWNVRMEIETPTEFPAVGEFKQDGNHLTGTFLTETGDYRYLEGQVTGDDIFLSCFDGSHAFYFDGKVTESGNILGQFLSGIHYKTNWTGVRGGENSMSNAYEFSQISDEIEQVSFSFPDVNGNLVSLDDEKYADKPKIIQIMGTWCPNCMDETNFLLDYLAENPNKDINIIGLAFERYRDKEKAITAIKNYVTAKSIPYEILYAGYHDKKEATKTLNLLKEVKSYPTLIFLDNQNRVKKIHTGFAGPATSEYESFKSEFDNIITELLAE